MQIQLNTDNNIHGSEELGERIDRELSAALDRFSELLTRIEVHLADESAKRSTGDDLRCVLEARPRGGAPVVVTHHAGSLDDAVRGATDKLVKVLDHHFDRHAAHKGGDTLRGRAADPELP